MQDSVFSLLKQQKRPPKPDKWKAKSHRSKKDAKWLADPSSLDAVFPVSQSIQIDHSLLDAGHVQLIRPQQQKNPQHSFATARQASRDNSNSPASRRYANRGQMPKQEEQVRESQDQRNSDLWCETQDVDIFEENELDEDDIDCSDIELTSDSERSISPDSISKTSGK